MSKSPHLNRREFLGRSMAAAGVGAGFAIGGTKSSGRIIGANDTIRLGIAGIHGRGGEHVKQFGDMKGVEITYLIDPDTRTYGSKVQHLTSNGGPAPKTVKDIRQALDDPNLDAVSVATPNHWHSLITIWACQAGKDVYVEKPCSHNVHEGRVAVETARRYGRVVQHGTQGRSLAQWPDLLEVTKSGKYGKLLVSRALCYKPRPSIGVKEITTPPEQVDFDIWLGPAPKQPFHANLVHYNWHWFWDFGNGDIGNQGVHQMDVARWMIPGATLPKSVMSLGGRFGYSDQGQTPNTQVAVFDHGDTQLIFEVRGLPTGPYHGEMVDNILHYEEGTVAPTKGGLRFVAKNEKDGKGELLPKSRRSNTNHFANFIAAVRSRKTEDLNADILEGHYSSAHCHLANISYRLGTQVPFNPQTKALGDDKEAYETLSRMEDHLSNRNGLKLDGLSYTLGRKLAVDAKAEAFVNDPEANAHLTRAYRKPYTITGSV